MVETLLLPFSYNYMTNAMWVSALVGGVCAFLSAYLMLKGWSLIGDALSHSIVPGVALTYMMGLPFVIGAFFSGGLAAVAMLFLKQRTPLKEDAVIGLIFSSFFGLGLFLVSLSPTSVDVKTITLGNILAITPEDTLQLLLIVIISLAVLILKWRDLMVVFFDEAYARSIGLKPERLNLIFFTILSACCVTALQTVGAFLVIALVITPGATAYLLTDRFPRLLILSVIIGTVSSFIGAYASFFLDGATGGIIICLQTALFGLAFIFCSKTWPSGSAEPNIHSFRIVLMIETLLLPLTFSFMQKAFMIGLIIAVPTAFLSCFLIIKGWSLMGDAISHAILPGVVLSYILNFPLILGAFAAGMCCALTTGYLSENCRVKRDTIMGVVFSGMFALGLVLYTSIESDVHLDQILFGNMLGINGSDLVTALIISICVTLFLIIKLSDLLLQSFDPGQANAIGLNVEALHFGLLAALSMTVVATLKATGLILAISLMIAPGAIAFLLTNQFKRMIPIAIALTMAAIICGIYLSFWIDSAPAPTVILFLTLIFLLAFFRRNKAKQITTSDMAKELEKTTTSSS